MRFLPLLILAAGLPQDTVKTETFDRDPGWEAKNNRSAEPRTIRQDFGFSAAKSAAGGFLSGAAEAAYYARKIAAKTFDDALSASGTFTCDGRGFHALLGFFNSETINEWRTPNAISIRLMGRGDVFFAWLEYANSRWRAGGDEPQSFPTVTDPQTGRKQFKGYAKGAVHTWSLKYDPKANNGAGAVLATINGDTAICHLDPAHRIEGATFNRFGLMNVMKAADGGGELWIDDVTVNGERENFDKDPGWEDFQNRRTYESRNARPKFDFGYSATQHAGGKGSGELGGLVFRGDCRYPDRMACYGDRLAALTLEKPLRASGKVSLRRGVTDSTTILGFYHSADSLESNPSQSSGIPKNFIGVAIEGPSREGFQFYPLFRLQNGEQGYARNGPHILPNGASHDWTFEYLPEPRRVTVTLGGKPITLDIPAGAARFDRFGLVTTWIDGNGQHIYFDDLTYTAR